MAFYVDSYEGNYNDYLILFLNDIKQITIRNSSLCSKISDKFSISNGIMFYFTIVKTR